MCTLQQVGIFLQFLRSLKVLVKLNLLEFFCQHIKNFTTFLKSATAIKEHAAQKDLIVQIRSCLILIYMMFEPTLTEKKQLVTPC